MWGFRFIVWVFIYDIFIYKFWGSRNRLFGFSVVLRRAVSFFRSSWGRGRGVGAFVTRNMVRFLMASGLNDR